MTVSGRSWESYAGKKEKSGKARPRKMNKPLYREKAVRKGTCM